MSASTQITVQSENAVACGATVLNDDCLEVGAASDRVHLRHKQFSEQQEPLVHTRDDLPNEPNRVIRWWGINE